MVPDLLLVDRKDGGHLCVDPPRDVWERGELSACADIVARARRLLADRYGVTSPRSASG